MKVEILFKDPDALIDCVDDRLKDWKVEGISEEEMESLKEIRRAEILKLCHKWFEYGEYLKVEVDTDKGTCVVLEN